MNLVLQLSLIGFCFILFGLIISQITKARVIFSDFNYWIYFIVILLIMSVFPVVPIFLAKIFGIQNIVFAVFLFVIFLLILLLLSASLRISVLNRRFISLTQKIALLEDKLETHIQQQKDKS